MIELYQARDRVYNKLKGVIPELANAKLSDLDFSDSDVPDSIPEGKYFRMFPSIDPEGPFWGCNCSWRYFYSAFKNYRYHT